MLDEGSPVGPASQCAEKQVVHLNHTDKGALARLWGDGEQTPAFPGGGLAP